jgi:hypothetical protein
MRPLRYSINVTLDGCCDHREMFADEDLHRHAAENLDQADALLFGRVTYEMMETAWRPPARTGAKPDWMEPFARTIDVAKKYVVSSRIRLEGTRRGVIDRSEVEAEFARVARMVRAHILRLASDAPCALSGRSEAEVDVWMQEAIRRPLEHVKACPGVS